MAVQSTLVLSPDAWDRPIKKALSALTGLYLNHRTKISRTVYLTLFLALANRVRNAISEQKAASFHQAQVRLRPGTAPSEAEATTRKRVELNAGFFRAIWRLLKIVIPGWRSKELRLIISHTFFLVIRTLLSLYVAELDGKLVSSLVRGKGKEFLRGIVWWMIVAVPATFTNSMVSWLFASYNPYLMLFPAVISSVQVSSSVSQPPHQLPSYTLSFSNDILQPFGAGRPNKERRSTHYSRRCEIL